METIRLATSKAQDKHLDDHHNLLRLQRREALAPRCQLSLGSALPAQPSEFWAKISFEEVLVTAKENLLWNFDIVYTYASPLMLGDRNNLGGPSAF
jgi:hypothetical protein